MNLRPYQQQAIDSVFAAEARGVRCQALVLATGLGKTVIFSHLIARRGGRALVLCHREELIQQAAQKIMAVQPGARVGVVRGEIDQHHADIVVASVPTLSRERRLKRLRADFSTVIVDECFPAGTLIDGTPIERIKVGDTVNCYDHSKHQITRRKVTDVMRKPASILVEITLSNKKRIICTPNHPVYSKAVSNYVPAITLRAGDELFSQKEKVSDNSENVFGLQNAEVEVSGSQEDGNLECVRVDGIAILERGSNDRFEQVCPDGHVYNFSVEEHHNYFAEGVLVHNCHHAAAASYERIFEHVAPSNPLLVGVTATPDRSDGKGLDKWFSEVVFEMSILDGIQQGWLCNLEGKLIHLKDADFSKVHVKKGDYDLSELEVIMQAANWHEHVANAWAEHARERKTVIFVPKVAMAHALADQIRSMGGRAEAIDGAMDRALRRSVLKRLSSGQTNVIVNCAVLTEGFDEPSLSCVIMARPTKSRGLYVQCVGRGLRLHDGKENCLVLDMVGVSQRHDLVTLASLAGTEKLKDGENFTEAKQRAEEEQKEAEEKAAAEKEAAERLEAELAAKRVELLKWQNKPLEKKRQPEFAWQQGIDHRRTLHVRDRMIVVRPMADENWIATDGQKFRAICATAEDCQREAESFARTLFFGGQNAAWRQKPASEKQINLMTKLRICFAPNISAGEASDLIDARFKKVKVAA